MRSQSQQPGRLERMVAPLPEQSLRKGIQIGQPVVVEIHPARGHTLVRQSYRSRIDDRKPSASVVEQQRVAGLGGREYIEPAVPAKIGNHELAVDEPVLVGNPFQLGVVGPGELAAADEFARKELALMVAIEVEAGVLGGQ